MANPVRTARGAAEWTQAELADHAGVAISTIQRAEDGMPLLAISEARISRALGVPVGELFPDPAPQEATA